jgi:hypothetical protein
MDRLNMIQKPLLALNKKRDALYVISRSNPTSIVIRALKANQVIEKPISLDFSPNKITSTDDFLVIKGDYDLAVYNPDTDTVQKLLKNGSKILSVNWHSLSDRCIGVLTGDLMLSLYTLPNTVPDFTYNFSSYDPVSFSFFEERPRSLFRFGCVVLMSDGDLYTLSPVVPKSFMANKDLLEFCSIFNVPNNSYVRYEPRVIEWINELDAKILFESRNWNKICIEGFRSPSPVIRGPCYSSKVPCSEVQVVSAAHPSVLAVVTNEGNILVLVGAGDLVPSFSVGEPSIEWSLYEELKFDKKGILLSSDFLIYYTNSTLNQIDLPWLPSIKECYRTKKAPKNLPGCNIIRLETQIEVYDMVYITKDIHNILVLSLSNQIINFDLKNSYKHEKIFQIDRKFLECEIKDLPKIDLPSTEALKKVVLDIPNFEGDQYEVMKLLEVFDSMIEKNVKPLAERVDVTRQRFEEFSKKNQVLEKNFEILAKKIEELENFSQRINEKIRVVKENDELIRNRIQDVVDIQQNVRRPLTSAEKELSVRLTHLENISKALKNHATEVRLI